MEASRGESSASGLLELPVNVIAIICDMLNVCEAWALGQLCKKTFRAFCDDEAWMRRCRVQGIDATLERQGSWMSHYRLNRKWRVEVLTVWSHRGGRSSNGSFTVLVSPYMSIRQFMNLVRDNPLNEQRGRAWNQDYVPELKPHDPALLGPWPLDEMEVAKIEELEDVTPLPIAWEMSVIGVGRYEAAEFSTKRTDIIPPVAEAPPHVGSNDHPMIERPPASLANCRFVCDNLDATLAEAGLCNGAILEQPERMMRD